MADERQLATLVTEATAQSRELGTFGGVLLGRWEDPSGAALITSRRDGQILGLLPMFDSGVGARVADCRILAADLLTAAVVDENGEQISAMAFESPQYQQLADQAGTSSGAWSGTVAVTALGVEVGLFADADAYAASPAGLVGDDRRWAPESFVSYGVFGDPAQATAHAHLAGTVLRAERRTNGRTGQQFLACEVRTAGFQVTVCLAGTEHPADPRPGSVLAGTVFLIGELELDTSAGRRRHR